MHLKHLLIISMLLLAGMHCLAQKGAYNKTPEFLKANSVWAFGYRAGLDFNSGTAVPKSTHQYSQEGSATVSDPITGKLLFYSNGYKVWNANHSVMPNGSGLLGNSKDTTGVELSTVQGAYIVPVINKPGQYYLFSLSGPTSGGAKPAGSLFYNIIDMNLNGGLGDVVAGKKNITLDKDALSEAMIAIPGNNCDLWLMVHSFLEHKYKAYHITEQGIDTVPIISNTGVGGLAYIQSSMVVSPDRTKICLVSGGLFSWFLLHQFDATTGKVKHDMMLDAAPPTVPQKIWWVPWSAAFSPDNSKLYVNVINFFNPSAGVGGIYQYDLSKYDSTAIDISKTSISGPLLIGNLAFGPSYLSSGGTVALPSLLRLYNDTIYTGMYGAIHRINKPNLLGTSCDLQLNAIQLPPSDTCGGNFGTEVVYPFVDTLSDVHEVFTCENSPSAILQAPKGSSTYIWEDGSTGESRNVKKLGKYWVKHKPIADFCNARVDTFVVSPSEFIEPVITINVQTLGTTASYDAYQWMLEGELINGANDSIFVVNKNGNYQVIVHLGDCIDTSEVYRVTNAGGGSGIDYKELMNTDFIVYPNPAVEMISIHPNVNANVLITSVVGKVIRRQRGVNDISVKGLTEGIYLLHILDDKNRIIQVIKFTKLP